jgi:Uma2 family endonuclease
MKTSAKEVQVMAVQTQARRIPMSREEFDRLPEGPPFYDYVNGEAVEVNRPSVKHQDIVVCLAFVIRQHVRQNDLGLVAADVNVTLPAGNTFAPDVVFLHKDHLAGYDEDRGDIHGAPDIVVEISSPSTMAYDRVEKLGHYHDAEVPWVWLIDQESLTVEEYRWTPEGYLRSGAAGGGQAFRPKLFPGLEINLLELIGAARE